MYDLIGDVHGHADELEALLRALGYGPVRGVWRHPSRRAVFVGDLMDRGPRVREALDLVRGMVEEESALMVLGNHEWNALGWHREHPERAGEALRPHTPERLRQHGATLEQVPACELASHLEWLATLPIALDLGGLRVVHACWDEAALALVEHRLAADGGLTEPFLVEAFEKGTDLYAATETLLKGREVDLPAGTAFVDKDGTVRTSARTRWFLPPDGHKLGTYLIPEQPALADRPLPPELAGGGYPPAAPLVFFGHYWLDGPHPAAQSPNTVCLDWSVARGGFLCAYRWEGEARARAEGFVTMPAVSRRAATEPEGRAVKPAEAPSR